MLILSVLSVRYAAPVFHYADPVCPFCPLYLPCLSPWLCCSNGNGFEEPAGGPAEWDEYSTELVDSGEAGVPVRAVYDYDGVEADELSFKAGV